MSGYTTPELWNVVTRIERRQARLIAKMGGYESLCAKGAIKPTVDISSV